MKDEWATAPRLRFRQGCARADAAADSKPHLNLVRAEVGMLRGFAERLEGVEKGLSCCAERNIRSEFAQQFEQEDRKGREATEDNFPIFPAFLFRFSGELVVLDFPLRSE